jgi:Arm DNA-binding domain
MLLDAKVRGLGLRITPGGTATWVLVYRPKGSVAPYRLMLGHYPDLGLGARATSPRSSAARSPRAQTP